MARRSSVGFTKPAGAEVTASSYPCCRHVRPPDRHHLLRLVLSRGFRHPGDITMALYSGGNLARAHPHESCVPKMPGTAIKDKSRRADLVGSSLDLGALSITAEPP